MFHARVILAAFVSFLPATRLLAVPPLSTEKVIQDLRYFRDIWAARDKSFSPEARRQMLSFVNQRIADAHPMERADLALLFAQAATYSGNNHTLIYIYDAPDVFHPLPISFWRFPEGAIVTRAHPRYMHLLGARITAIGGVPIEEAARRVDQFIPGTASHKRYISPLWLTRIEALRAIHVTKGDTAQFEFELQSGTHASEQLPALRGGDPVALDPPWQESMVPDNRPQSWPHVLDRLKKLPPYLEGSVELSWKLMLNGSLLYVRSTTLSSHAVEVNAYRMIDGVVKSGHIPDNVVVDVRFNEGGDLFNVLTLATELVKLTEPRGGIYVITGRATNSAAIVLTALLKGHAPDRTRIVGEEISDHEWFWSEGGALTAPASGLPLSYTDGYHDWAHGCTDLGKCYWPVVFFGVSAGSLSPQIPVILTYREYILGRDPALEAIRADIAAKNR